MTSNLLAGRLSWVSMMGCRPSLCYDLRVNSDPKPADCAFRALGRREANGAAKPALKVLELIGATTIVTLPIQVRDVA
jgi:hypothetical protein